AIKYTDHGGVLVALRRQGRDRIALEIWDTGLGIGEGEQRRIFDEFHQINNPGRDQSQGIGLGLSIVRRTTGLLGLDLNLASQLGKGSKFSLDFALMPIPVKPAGDGKTPWPDEDLRGVSALVVDDNQDIRLSLSLRLQDWNCKVETADSLDSAASVLDVFLPDILLTDFQLKNEENGVMIIDLVRERLGIDVPGIVITGTTLAETSEISQRPNVEILYKPVRSDELRQAMVKVLNC
ncbi:MAG: ATP-binding protein, partial [Coleofasciculus sp. C2-GNP5-27]